MKHERYEQHGRHAWHAWHEDRVGMVERPVLAGHPIPVLSVLLVLVVLPVLRPGSCPLPPAPGP